MSFVCGAILVGFIGYIYGFIAYNATFIVGTGPTINADNKSWRHTFWG